MTSVLHDAGYRSDVVRRVKILRADSPRQWGRMTIGQMFWHVNEAMTAALGQIPYQSSKSPLPGSLLKFLVLNAPWGKAAQTLPMFLATDSHDFEPGRQRFLQLIDEFAAKPLDDEWPHHPLFGKVSGRDMSRLHAKHLNHHLRQFGA